MDVHTHRHTHTGHVLRTANRTIIRLASSWGFSPMYTKKFYLYLLKHRSFKSLSSSDTWVITFINVCIGEYYLQLQKLQRWLCNFKIFKGADSSVLNKTYCKLNPLDSMIPSVIYKLINYYVGYRMYTYPLKKELVVCVRCCYAVR